MNNKGSSSKSFIWQVLQTIFTRFAVQSISIIGSIFIIRELGIYERGQFAFAASIIAIGIQFANLGFHSVNTIHLSKKPTLLNAILANNTIIITAGTALFILIFSLIYSLSFTSNSDAKASILIGLLCVPIGLLSLFNQNILIALGKIQDFNITEFIQKFTFVLLAVPAAFLTNSAETVLICSFLSFLATYIYTKKTFQNKFSHFKKNIDLNLIKSSTKTAIKLYSVCLCMFLILKIDIWMIEAILGTKATGIYSVASSLTDSLLIVPSIVGQLIFPRFVKNIGSRRKELFQTILLIFAFMIPVCFFVYFFSGNIITLIFGESFIASSLSLRWLAFAASFLGANTILMNYLSAKEIPSFVFLSLILSCLLNIILNFLLLRDIGIHGAAISSLVAYLGIFILNSFYILFLDKSDSKDNKLEDNNSICSSTNNK
ncbi:oligosaccharide flippase family protein [Halobacteriovorax sp. JY17]|uniref:oligosaccharide flippase family protein n=1 Tax=Halobacteriovorax sp. JY17 TaxID=2014617 RepID=UPI000C6369E9|nr:oligosaccharide flippase family protein [Halobacteriovorax sp. JY17]PIK14675.1 MAG: hypothetical protein CES88_10075 [Halobacteriovorax sp. JY17]